MIAYYGVQSPRTARWTQRTMVLVVIVLGVVGGNATIALSQEPVAPQAVSAAQLQAAIDKLGDLDYATRTNASRTVRRTACTRRA